MTVVTRIAPSPTGDPHVGTAYIGLFNYVFAKKHGGKFLFRLEDTDRERYDAASEGRILDMMRWLGLEPDEGPGVGGPNGPYQQSERLAVYREHVDGLLASGHAYRAFETEAELADMRKEQKRLGRGIGYDGRGREVPRDEQERRAEAGEAHVVRLKAPTEGAVVIRDELRGDISFEHGEVRDNVLLKSDGYPTYHLAVVVDDHLMGVTHVIRAEEWISSTPIHVCLYEAFGWDAPAFVHMPLLRNPDKSKVSKRKLDTSVDSYRAQGVLPEALLNFLGTLSWSMPDGRDFFTVQEMMEHFELSRISLGGPVFDLKRLRHFNATYIRERLTLDELAERLVPRFEQEGFTWDEEDYLLDVIDVLRPRAEMLEDFVEQGRYFFTEDYAFTDDARKKVAAGQAHLEDLEREFSMLEFFDFDAVEDLLNEYVRSKEVKKFQVLMPLRAALTGTTNAPSVTDLVVILGRSEVLRRIGRALQMMTQALPDDDPGREAEAAS